jgi:hypothetical protein
VVDPNEKEETVWRKATTLLRDATAERILERLSDLKDHPEEAIAPYEEFSVDGSTYYYFARAGSSTLRTQEHKRWGLLLRLPHRRGPAPQNRRRLTLLAPTVFGGPGSLSGLQPPFLPSNCCANPPSEAIMGQGRESDRVTARTMRRCWRCEGCSVAVCDASQPPTKRGCSGGSWSTWSATIPGKRPEARIREVVAAHSYGFEELAIVGADTEAEFGIDPY